MPGPYVHFAINVDECYDFVGVFHLRTARAFFPVVIFANLAFEETTLLRPHVVVLGVHDGGVIVLRPVILPLETYMALDFRLFTL